MTEWQAFRSVIMPLAAIRNASREDLLELKGLIERTVPEIANSPNKFANHTPDGIRQPVVGSPKPSV